MRLVDFAVRRWQFTVLLFLMLIALGGMSWLTIPRAEDPSFPVPVFTTVAVYPGADAEDMEQQVVEPIERRLATLQRIKEMRSSASDGLAVITVEFEPSVDADRKEDEVLREVNAMRPSLPAGLLRLDVVRNENNTVAIAQLALVSETTPYHELDVLAERLEERVERVAGVRQADRAGAPTRELQVTLDLGRLATLNVAPAQVLQALASDNAAIPGGSVDVGPRRFNVSASGRYRSLDEVRATVVAGAQGSLVRVGDVAEVQWGYADPVHVTRWNGRRAVFVSVTKQTDANITTVRDGIWHVLDAFEGTLPAGVTLERGFDQSVNVRARLGRLTTDFLIALGLVIITLLPLGQRAALVVMVSIPLSLAIAVALLQATGFSLNQLSIVGFVIALGLLVDDSIVVVENITRFLRSGMTRAAAAIEGTKQIAVAVLGSTGTLVLAFLPLLFLPGLPGRYIRSLPAAVVFAVVASLFVSFTVIPWLASLLLPREEPAEGNRFLQALDRGIRATYAPLLGRALAHPWRTLGVAGALVVGSLALVPVVGFSLFPVAGTPQVHVDIEAPDGASLDETDRAVRYAERVVGTHPAVRGVFANVGKDNPVVYYNVFQRNEQSNRGQLFVLLHEYHGTRTPRLLDSLRQQLAAYPGARIELKEYENGPPIEAPIALRVEGPDLDSLRVLAARVQAVLEATPGTQYVRNPVRLQRTDLRLEVDREKAGLLGIPSVEIDRTLRLGLAGLEAGLYRGDDGNDHPIMVRLSHNGRPIPEALDRIWVPSVSGALVPLGQVASLGFEARPPVIAHRDRERAVTVTSYVRSGYNTDRVTRAVLAELERLDLPTGYRLIAAGEIESREESFGGIGAAIIVAVFGVLAILVLEFRRFRTTWVVASVIPLGVVGGVLALLLTGNTLSFTALIGFVALVGIEIKTSILLVDFTDQLRREGFALDEAIQRAGEIRFVPIVLTAITAIGGLLPLAVQGSALYSPLAWVIIGGLISSTFIARLVTPVLYKLLATPTVDEVEEPAPPAPRLLPLGHAPA
jgi:multidrug efflux pump subunit AcrB